MDNLIFCLNATVPVFLMMVLGFVFKKIKLFSDDFAKKLNKFVFTVALPVLVFQDLSQDDIRALWNGKYVLVCLGITIISIAISLGISFLFKDRSFQAEFIQSSYRSSAALLGIGIIQNIYGHSGMAPLMIIGAVPMYNIFAVVVLCILKPDGKKGKLSKEQILSTLKGIALNPILIGIAIGIVWSLLRIPQPEIMKKTVKYIAALATPLGLMALGASLDFKNVISKIRPVIVATVLKLVVFCGIFIPIVLKIGYREDEVISILIMLGSPTTVSAFVMAKSMGHEGTVSSGVIMLTTLFSAFTLTGWLYLLRVLGAI